MKQLFYFLTILGLFLSCSKPEQKEQLTSEPQSIKKPVLIIHGGAGYMSTNNLSDSMQVEYHKALNHALQIGFAGLRNGEKSIEAVESAIMYLEDNPLFNAGKGSVLNSLGEVENDASIMNGSTLECGAVAGLQNVRNPITLARLVMDSTQHVMLSGIGASKFADHMNAPRVNQEYYMTDKRRKQREEILKKAGKMGTVGCVALDEDGDISAGTSTGGMMMKKYGRIGDSPIIGAGTYANGTAGVSCTGHGEYFIKNAVAYDVIARMEYRDESLQQACENIVMNKLVDQEANGGLIALDKNGNASFSFNTPGMFRGYIDSDTSYTLIFK